MLHRSCSDVPTRAMLPVLLIRQSLAGPAYPMQTASNGAE
jgi:hypothetical protein